MKIHRLKAFISFVVIVHAHMLSAASNDGQTEMYKKIKAHLMLEFTAIDGSECASAAWVRQNMGADDADIRKAMFDIYSDASATFTTAQDDHVRSISQMREDGAVRELWGCADAQTRSFLMGIALDKGERSWLRGIAISSSLRAASSEEAKNILLRFLVGADKMDDMARSSIYRCAQTAFNDADACKRAAIFNALCIAAAVESPQWVFEECDSMMIDMYPEYKDSLLRESMLRRQIAFPFSKYHLRIKDQIENELKRLEKLRNRVGISTNLAALTQYYNRPQPVLKKDSSSGHVQKNVDAKTDAGKRIPLVFGLFTVAALTAATGFWLYRRKHAV